VAVVLTVHNQDGAQRAGAEAPHRLEGEFHVRRGLAGLQPQRRLDVVVDHRGAANVAGRSEAEHQVMPAAGRETECLVEGRHLIDAACGNIQLRANRLEGLFGKVVELLLHILKDGDDVTLVRAVFLDDAFDLLFHRVLPLFDSL